MTKDKTATGTVKGVIRKYNDQSLEFTPFGKGEPVYEEQQKFKNGVTIAKTRGANGKRVVRIPLEAADVDVYDACVTKLGAVMPSEHYPLPLRASCMMIDGPALQMVHERKTNKIIVHMEVDMCSYEKMQKRMFNLFNQINLCLAINKTIFHPVN